MPPSIRRFVVMLALPVLVLGLPICSAQDSPATAMTEAKLSGFQWLKQFEGTWTTASKSPKTGDVPANTSTGIMKSHALGEVWMINEYNAKFGDTKFNALQTIGYDTVKKQFNVTWVDSFLNFTWQYTGTLNDSGTKLTMDAEGPDMSDPKKTRKYRDSYEFKSATECLTVSQMMNEEGEWQTIMAGSMNKLGKGKLKSKTTVTPFLMFTGKAEEAINFYKTVFPVKVESMNKYKAGETGKEGTIQLATIIVAGQRVKCIDSPPVHDFDFTPSFSFFVECENEAQLKDRFKALSAGGKVMMPLDNYGFSKQFAWTSDKFGISWQLNLK